MIAGLPEKIAVISGLLPPGLGAAFGKVTAKSNNPRIVQLALKVVF